MKRFVLIMVMLFIVSPSYALFCQDCGSKVSDAANFCSQCGNRIAGAFTEPPPTSESALPPIQHSAEFAVQVPTRAVAQMPTFHVNPSGVIIPTILSGLAKTLFRGHFVASTPLLGLALLASLVQSTDGRIDNRDSMPAPICGTPETEAVVVKRDNMYYPIWGRGTSQALYAPARFQENAVKVVVSDHYGSFSRPYARANRTAEIPSVGTNRVIPSGHRHYTGAGPITRAGNSAAPHYRTAPVGRVHDSHHTTSGHTISDRSTSARHRDGNRRIASSR
ncbi:MAG: zinc ribbon domain-containing protein [Candidatus Riflebacteria bacterium]|nr:zinc ribbon domain-containing protein [Candidatus Riflebacteria bacterium]